MTQCCMRCIDPSTARAHAGCTTHLRKRAHLLIALLLSVSSLGGFGKPLLQRCGLDQRLRCGRLLLA